MESVSKSQYFRKFYLGTIDESNSYDKVVSMVKENVKKLISTYGKCVTINIIKSQLEEFFVYDEDYTTQKMVNEISDEITREEEFKRYIENVMEKKVRKADDVREEKCACKNTIKYTLKDALDAHKTSIIISEIEKLYDIVFDEMECARYTKFIDGLRRKKPMSSIVKINVKAEYENGECIFAEPEGYQH